MAIITPCHCMGCILLNGNRGKNALPQATLRHRLQKDLCQNPHKYQTPTRKYQSPSMIKPISTPRFSVQVQSKARIDSRMTSNFQAKPNTSVHSNICLHSRQIGRARDYVQTPNRYSRSNGNDLRTIQSERKIVPRTLIGSRLTNSVRTPSKLDQNRRTFTVESAAIANDQEAGNSDAKNAPAIPVSTVNAEPTPSEAASAEKCELGDEFIAEENAITQTTMNPSAIDDIEVIALMNDPTPEVSSVQSFEESNHNQKQESEVDIEKSTVPANHTNCITTMASDTECTEESPIAVHESNHTTNEATKVESETQIAPTSDSDDGEWFGWCGNACENITYSSLIAGIEKMSMTENNSTLEKSLITSQEKIHTQNDTSTVASASESDRANTKTSQSKWAAEVLNLLNTGTDKQINKKLATVGLKTAAQIVKCREIHGEYQHIANLCQMLGWSENVYKKFLAKNFL